MTELIVDLSGKSADFILGLEAGKIWNMLSIAMGEEVAGVCHEANRDVIEKVAASKEWDIEFASTESGVWVTFTAHRRPPPTVVPRLRVVQ